MKESEVTTHIGSLQTGINSDGTTTLSIGGLSVTGRGYFLTVGYSYQIPFTSIGFGVNVTFNPLLVVPVLVSDGALAPICAF